jgi:hypothetical protein
MDALEPLLGHWAGAETLAPSAWSAGGTATGRLRLRPAADGRIVLLDAVQERDGAVTLDGHGVLSPAGDPGAYRWHWFDSLGFFAADAGTGAWADDALVLRRSSPRGINQTVIARDGDALVQEISFLASGADAFAPVLSGRYARADPPAG